MSLLVAYILICLALIIIGYLIVRKFFNPITIFVSLWLGIVLLYQLQLSKLQRPISDQTYITLMICVVFFVALFILAYNIMYISNTVKRIKNRKGSREGTVKIDIVDKGENEKVQFKMRKKVKKPTPSRRVDIMLPNSHLAVKGDDKASLANRGKMISDVVSGKSSNKTSQNKRINHPTNIKKASYRGRGKIISEIITNEQSNRRVVVRASDLHNSKQKRISRSEQVEENDKSRRQKKKIITFKLILCLFAVWFVVECIEVLYSRGVPILWKFMHVNKGYFDFGITSLHGLMNAFGLVIITMSAYLYEVTKKDEKKKNYWLWAIIGVMLGFYAIILTRQVMISAIIQIVVIKLLFMPKKAWWKVAIGGAVFGLVGVTAFGVLGNMRTGYENFLKVSYMKDDLGEWASGFQWVYMYLTMTIANVNELVELGIDDLGLGAILPQRLPNIMNGLYSSETKPIRHLIVDSYNVSGFFNDYYLGFGNAGVAVISAFYGLLGGYFYFKIRTKRSAKYIIYYATYLQFILLSFFADYLIFLADGSQFIIIYLIFKIRERVLNKVKKPVSKKVGGRITATKSKNNLLVRGKSINIANG